MAPLLEVKELSVSYRGVHAVRGVGLELERGEVIAVLGPNGAGKTSLVNGIAGFGPIVGGQVLLDGVEITGMRPHRRARAGIALVPSGRWLFGQLTVAQNLRLGANMPRRKMRPTSEAFELFPELADLTDNQASTLSGGEQQMLAIARALLSAPDVLILDEPSLGLAPVVVERVYAALSALKANGQSLLIVEERTEFAVQLSDRYIALHSGDVIDGGESADADPTVLAKTYLG